jgi:L-fuconolactonase
MAELAPILHANGVERIVLVQAAETLAETLYTIGTALADPRIAGVVGWCDLGSPSLAEEVRALGATGRLKGFRPVRDDNVSIAWLREAHLAPGLALLEREGLVLDILLQNPDELPFVTELSACYPRLQIVLDHAGKPDVTGGRLGPWRRDIDALAALSNVACKLSGLLNCAPAGAGAEVLRPYVDHLVQCFGGERLIWASDWPPLTLAAPYDRWLALTRELLGGIEPAAREV